jgi:uncharacterized protein involved in copper resistance
MLRIFCSFAVPMHKRGAGRSNSCEQLDSAAANSAKATHKNSDSISMDTDEVMELNSSKRKIHARIAAPSIESVTNGCKRIKLFNKVNVSQQHSNEVPKQPSDMCMVNIDNIVVTNQDA